MKPGTIGLIVALASTAIGFAAIAGLPAPGIFILAVVVGAAVFLSALEY